ncbi:MAG: type II/IV secretion system ATPase subunit [Candidatus Thermoplasmatota archaeon]
MAQHVPILDFIHELRAAGIEVEYADVLTRPQAYWERLSVDRRALLFARLKMDVPHDPALSVQVVRRRAHTAQAENVFVRLIPTSGESRVSLSRARDSLFYSTTTPPEATTPSGGSPSEIAPLEAFQPGSARQERPLSALCLLDAVWGAPYDATRDGALYASDVPDEYKLVEEYEVEPSFSSISIIIRGDSEKRYQVNEPRLSELELALAATLNERLRDALVFDDGGQGDDRPRHIAKHLFALLHAYRFRVDQRTAYKLGYYFLRNYAGFGRLDPLMRDAAIEDISCNGPDVPLYVVHSKHQNLPTSLVFEEMELNSFTIKLAQRGGKLLSVAQPLIDATLPEGSRIQASLGREVTSRGSAFTIRKFREDPLTAVDLIRGGTHTLDTMAFLWLMVEAKRNLVVMGATASGKTTTLNCLSQFVPPTLKVVSIEDTREITLQHENWLAAVTRDSFSGQESEKISMYDLLRAALRQRPEYIIVGEIRGVEGLTLFQAMSTGHTCFSTMHAGSVENAVYRLENAPISVPRVMLTSLDFFLLQGAVEVAGRQVRRMLSLVEVNGVDPASRNLRTNEVFRWDATRDAQEAANASTVLDQVRNKRGWSRAQLDEEIAARKRVLAGLVERKERSYQQVATAVRAFYADGRSVPAPPSASAKGGARR